MCLYDGSMQLRVTFIVKVKGRAKSFVYTRYGFKLLNTPRVLEAMERKIFNNFQE